LASCVLQANLARPSPAWLLRLFWGSWWASGPRLVLQERGSPSGAPQMPDLEYAGVSSADTRVQ
jgi:hypothetical protein